MLKILKWKDFNRNRYLQRVRHTAPYGDHFGLLWRPFWIQNGRQNTKILPIWAKYGFQVDFILANWYPSSFLELGAINDPSDHIISCYYYYSSSSSRRDFVRPNSQRLMIRSLLSFTGRRSAFRSWKFQNGRQYKI